jgi:AcrR family transcriptional regulator
MNGAKLKYEMCIRGVSVSDICKELGISRSAFYRKCNGKSEFTQGEIQRIVDFLGLDTPVGIFFNAKVS